jgi:hypothetical protein
MASSPTGRLAIRRSGGGAADTMTRTSVPTVFDEVKHFNDRDRGIDGLIGS